MTPELFPGAFEEALAERRAEIDAIVATTDPPSFENTIAAMERAGRTLDRIDRMFGVARESVTNPAYQALEREWQPKLSEAADAILFNQGLFTRISAVYESLADSNLQPDQARVVTRIYEQFVRGGAHLNAADKQRLSDINQQLAARFAEFRAKVLADENTSTVAESGEAIVNTRSSVDPFLTLSPRRDLREIVWKKFKSRGANADANDTTATITDVVRLRAERARLLGYQSHAHWRMMDTMAADPETAQRFLLNIWPSVVTRVKAEVAEMQAIADRDDPPVTIEPWDFLYYAEKVRKARYDLDDAEIKPYFVLDNLVAAALWSAERRFGIAFQEITGSVPVFHPDVRVWNVVDAATGRHRAVLYLDNYARPGKRSGAWETSYRSQHAIDEPVTAIASINNNFVKAEPGTPALISLADAKTLFHEFGHALHSMLQSIRYPTLDMTPLDYVELPSQLNERWLLDRELLDRFARHYQTGEPIPQALVDKIERARRFNQGYSTLEYLAAAIVDMDLHTRSHGVDDMAAFEREAMARVGGMPREVALRHRLPHFDHLFGNDMYSAGYYSYLWSDVMAADAWQAFVEAGGPWDAGVNDRLRTHILSDGNSIDRAEAYRRFRGRDPDVRALLEARGFYTAEAVETARPADH
jgi:peptidyl-dipeptidase Dcp